MIAELESLTRDALAHGATSRIIVMSPDTARRVRAAEGVRWDEATLTTGTYQLVCRRYLPAGRLMVATQQWLDDYDECVRQFEEARRD